MSEMLSEIFSLLVDRILPHLKNIEASQAEQRAHYESMSRSLKDLQAEMQIRFAELRAEIAACRMELEDTMVTIRERDALDSADSGERRKKRLVH